MDFQRLSVAFVWGRDSCSRCSQSFSLFRIQNQPLRVAVVKIPFRTLEQLVQLILGELLDMLLPVVLRDRQDSLSSARKNITTVCKQIAAFSSLVCMLTSCIFRNPE
jgi:hypothetical protein